MNKKLAGALALSVLLGPATLMALAETGVVEIVGDLIVRSNATVDGAMTLGGVTRTSWPQELVAGGACVYSNDFSSDPFAGDWTKNAYAWWESGAIKLRGSYYGSPNGQAVYSKSPGYGLFAYTLVVTLENSVDHPMGATVYRDDVALASAGFSAAGQHTLTWTGSWDRIVLSGPGYQGEYAYVSDFYVFTPVSTYASTLLAGKIIAQEIVVEADTELRVRELLGVTNIVGPGAASTSVRISSGTPPLNYNSGDVMLETAGTDYGGWPGSIILRPGRNTYSGSGGGGSVNLYCGSAGPNRTQDGRISFYGLLSQNNWYEAAFMTSTGSWTFTGPVTASKFSGDGSGLLNLPAGGMSTNEADTRYVNVAGDTMTAPLELPADGLVVGGNQFVVNGGQVGIGTNSPSATLDVAGTAKFGQGVIYIYPVGDLSMGPYTQMP